MPAMPHDRAATAAMPNVTHFHADAGEIPISAATCAIGRKVAEPGASFSIRIAIHTPEGTRRAAPDCSETAFHLLILWSG
jgi:hypothetical protein